MLLTAWLRQAMCSREMGLEEMLPISKKTHYYFHSLPLLSLHLQPVRLSHYHAQAPYFANIFAITADRKRLSECYKTNLRISQKKQKQKITVIGCSYEQDMLKMTSPSHYKCLETAQPLQRSEILKWFNGHKEFRADNAASNLILSLHENR